MKTEVKNCKTCGHKSGTVCLLSGYHYETERLHPTVCGVNFKGWVSKKYPGSQKKKPLLDRIKKKFGFYEKPPNPLLEDLDDLTKSESDVD